MALLVDAAIRSTFVDALNVSVRASRVAHSRIRPQSLPVLPFSYRVWTVAGFGQILAAAAADNETVACAAQCLRAMMGTTAEE